MANELPDSKPNETSDATPSQVRHEQGSMGENKGTIAQGGNATLNDRLGVYIAVVALLVAGMGLGYEMSQSSSRAETRQLQDQVIDAKIAAGVANARASMQEQVATAQAIAHAAETNARISLDEVERMREALGRQHINIPKHD